MIKQIAVSNIIYFSKESKIKYLILKYAIYGQNHWDFVKGKVENGESLETTAKRESKEEANIAVLKLIKGFKDESRYTYTKDTGEEVDKRVIFLLSEISEEESSKVKISEEHSEFKWVTYLQAKKMLKFDAQKNALEKANRLISK